MSTVALGAAASHSTLMNTHWHEVAGVDRAERFRAGLSTARDEIAAARPDVVVIVGSNHFRGFWLDLMPAFTIGVGDCIASGESGTPSGPLTVDTELARHLVSYVVEREFDMAFSTKLQIDHGLTHAVQYLLAGIDVPIVPIVVNVFAPPLPTLARCEALGRALGIGITADGRAKRVVVIGSGGLSHVLPFPRWDAPVSDDDRFLVDAWSNGRANWQDYDPRRREIIRAASPVLAQDFDHDVLTMCETGRLHDVCEWTDDELRARAGNGGHEIRSWLIAAAMCGHAPARTIVYSPMPEWLTGMAVALFDPAPDRSQEAS
jgi:2,3-dihydroxyphenylpropionate 1,2-dioxygenase